MKNNFILVLSIALVFIFAACGTQTSSPDLKNVQQLNLDWEKLEEDFKSDSSVDKDFLQDIYVGLSDGGDIMISAVVMDNTNPQTVLDYADTLIRTLNALAMLQDNSISPGNKDYFGGLYDVYSLRIGISPASKTENISEWFVYDAIAKGVQGKHTIKLQKAYQ